jgi:hypothetical protein
MLSRNFSLSRRLQEDGSQISKILRSYDTRFRTTQRRSEIYEHYPENEKLVIIPCPDEQVHEAADNSSSEEHRLWRSPGELMVICALYRTGRHFAETPREFVPIIEALEQLHHDGFVHGDIRGFNTVFSSELKEGWLIDFDFGGKEDKKTTVFPKGYNVMLIDGLRYGTEGGLVKKWHDWYALGSLIFQ